MLTNLDEIIERWHEKYLKIGDPHYYLIETPGFSNYEIENLEQRLRVVLHPSLKSILQKLKLTSTSFGTVGIGINTNYLLNMNEPAHNGAVAQSDYLQIGSTDGYVFVLDNSTGNIYVVEDGTEQLQEVGRNLEEFICRIATIEENPWSKGFDRDDEAEKFLIENNIQQAHQFWIEVIRHVPDYNGF